ncbi:hypothetical protein BG07_609 [Bacillus pseudomycoides]|nr:hypothetical protein DJ92_4336 [Bacillus pseudomycoides]AJI18161.1 hypothetical protein BG07_609 [Bacillus pseudomycoides]KFN16131.1 hypothetical protein DJ94_2646 [Bacillus pseudomycoides]
MKNHTKDLIIALPFSISFSRKGAKAFASAPFLLPYV